MKRSVGIYEAKASLSKLIRAVRRNGISIQISDRGTPVAQLVPVTSSESLQDRIDELQQSGDLIAATDASKPALLKKKLGALDRFLAERE